MIDLIVNADDLGMSSTVNAAIAQGFAEGWLTSASLLAVGPAFDDAVRLNLPDVGVHLAATGFAPLTALPAHLCPLGIMAAPLHPSSADVVAIAAEWRAQIARVSAHQRPTHLDTHEHLHTFPRWAALLRRLSDELSLPVRRLGTFAPSGRTSPRAWLRRRLAPPMRGPTQFGSATCLRRATKDPFFPRHGVVEMMVHPGNPHDPRYAEEVAWLRAGRPGFPPARPIAWTAL